MRPKLSLVAMDVIIAADTGVPSAIHVVEGLMADSMPFTLPSISFLSVWHRDPKDPTELNGDMVVLMNGVELVSHSATVSFKGRSVARAVMTLKGLYIPAAGVLRFEYRVGDQVAGYEINIEVAPELKVGGDVVSKGEEIPANGEIAAELKS